MGQQMVMSLNEDLPCGFWAASRRLACACTCRKRFLMKLRSTPQLHMQEFLAFSFDVTAVTMTNNDVQQRDLDWPLFQWTRMSNPTELSISAEDEKSWLCDFVPKVMCNQKDEGSGEASTKTSKLHLHQKLPLKCTTKTYPKTASTFSTSSLSIHVAKKLLGARFGSSSSLWCNLVSEAWRQAATALHSYPHKGNMVLPCSWGDSKSLGIWFARLLS